MNIEGIEQDIETTLNSKITDNMSDEQLVAILHKTFLGAFKQLPPKRT